MKISVFGLGYVGCVTAACLAESGHEVWGVDIDAQKIAMINAGRSPVVEPHVHPMIAQARLTGVLGATADATEAVRSTELSLVCVGTPSGAGGRVELAALAGAARQIGAALGKTDRPHCVVFRSTMPPGTVRGVLVPLLEEVSGRKAHHDFDVCMHPEFLREGTAVADFYAPPFIVIGQERAAGGDAVARMYERHQASIERTTYEVAEMLKYACNAFHAMKVTFANEIGSLCKTLGVDGLRVMQLFTKDSKLNLSSAYLKPGFAFGGSCLPKDLRALLHTARQRDLALPLLDSVLESNRLHRERTIQRILDTGAKRIGILGLSFKPDTDDLRESPSVALVEALIGKGLEVKIYDPDVELARIFGANKRFIETEIPHISCLMSNELHDVIQKSDLVVVSKAAPEFSEAVAGVTPAKHVLDLVRLPIDTTTGATYEGVCW